MNSLSLTQQAPEQSRSVVRVVKQIDDPFAGLKGHAYIKARNLNKPVKRIVQTSAQTPTHVSIPLTGKMGDVFDALMNVAGVRS